MVIWCQHNMVKDTCYACWWENEKRATELASPKPPEKVEKEVTVQELTKGE